MDVGIRHVLPSLLLAAISLPSPAWSDSFSIGPNGIDSSSLPLTGQGVAIGMAEVGRPGIPGMDMPSNVHTSVVPTGVFFQEIGVADDGAIDDHAQGVAGVMISSHTAATGVAPGARLFASALSDGASLTTIALSLQNLVIQDNNDVSAVNVSFATGTGPGAVPDGNNFLTKFVDWSSRIHDTLYVVSGKQGLMTEELPRDHFNGITVASSEMGDGLKYNVVSNTNVFTSDPVTTRTFTDILSPGIGIGVTLTGDTEAFESGTSYATPHVTGAIALLQEHAKSQIAAGAPRWNPQARRHEVMKAVLMNSADKLEDTGDGLRLGMSRTLLDTNGDTWLESTAYSDPTQPLDI